MPTIKPLEMKIIQFFKKIIHNSGKQSNSLACYNGDLTGKNNPLMFTMSSSWFFSDDSSTVEFKFPLSLALLLEQHQAIRNFYSNMSIYVLLI